MPRRERAADRGNTEIEKKKKLRRTTMLRTRLWLSIYVLLICLVVSVSAQQAAPSAANAVVPPVVKFSGVLNDVNNKPLTGTVGVTFSLYKESEGGAPLWVETQNVTPDKTGHYSVILGSTTSQGLPADVFANGEARWLGVQVQGEAEKPRTVLMSVPYALKALDAETIGGKPASSFMLAPQAGGKSAPAGKLPPGTITGSGTADFIPRFTGATTLGNSNIFETVGGNVGIATTAPAAKLDVKGTEDVRNTLTLFPSGTHPALSVHGTAFEVSSTGLVTFASGQTFPGTGTVKSVGLSAPSSDFKVSGSPVTSSGTLRLSWTVAPTSADTPNAIVKRDANGEIAVTEIDAETTIDGLIAVLGSSDSNAGVAGVSNTSEGVFGAGTSGVVGEGSSNYGVLGTVGSSGIDGLHGETSSEFSGVAGLNLNSSSGYGVFGQAQSPSGIGGGFYNLSTGDALFADNQSGGFAAFFLGDVDVDGNLSKAGGSFKIDDPLDPANKYLYHSFVESPDMMNIYNGNVTTDEQGHALVQLPDWFETLNRDFRYQLTVIGQFAQAIVANEVSNHQFTIKTDKPNVKVSWQVTGIRQDAWANAHRIPVEVSKAPADRGFYLHPELFGAPIEKSIAVAHHPMILQVHKQAATKLKAPTNKLKTATK
jgi:trimeric autotransporter adhesin